MTALLDNAELLRESPIAVIGGSIMYGTHFNGTMEKPTEGALVLLVGCSAKAFHREDSYRALLFTGVTK
jgi:hypothetical protein